MVNLNPSRGSAYGRALFAAVLAVGLSAPALAASDLHTVAQPVPLFVPPAEIGEAPVLVAQNQQGSAQLLVRLQELEDQVRTMTGQIEGLQFQLTQMQTLLERQTADNEFRFQQLEGGAPGKPQAATGTDGATPSDTLPQDPARLADTPAADAPAAEQLPPTAEVPGEELPPLGVDQPLDFALGDSQDPLLGGGLDQLGTLSPEDQLSLEQSRPLDLSLDGGTISNGDAVAQYEAGYDAMTRGDYAFAEDQFGQFVALYPDDPQAPDATNWLGEALLQRGAYTDAAQVLADGYTRYRDSKRAPDMMLKLGVALAGADQVDVACRTFYTLGQRYPELSPAFQQRLTEEKQKAQCPVS